MSGSDHELPNEGISGNRIAGLEALAAIEGPIGPWFRQFQENCEETVGDIHTEGLHEFVFAGLCAYIDATKDPERIQKLDSVMLFPSLASRALERIVTVPAYCAIDAYYAQLFGNREDDQEAYFSFLKHAIGTFNEARDELTHRCYQQRLFEMGIPLFPDNL